jgi:Na+/melibiose symporter-like transporter
MGLAHAGIAFSVMNNNAILALIFMIIFIIVFQVTLGPLVFIYLAEINSDSGFGVGMFFMFVHMTLLIGLAEYLTTWLGSDGVFGAFSIVCLIGALLMHVFVRETVGLTDKEKKKLYSRSATKVT